MSARPTENTILIVEDEPTIRSILRRLLSQVAPKYYVDTVSNAIDALAYIREKTVDLIITDYSMPGMNGIELVVHAKQACPKTQIIMITAYSTNDIELQAHQVGVDAFLTKPFPLSTLIQTVQRALAS